MDSLEFDREYLFRPHGFDSSATEDVKKEESEGKAAIISDIASETLANSAQESSPLTEQEVTVIPKNEEEESLTNISHSENEREEESVREEELSPEGKEEKRSQSTRTFFSNVANEISSIFSSVFRPGSEKENPNETEAHEPNFDDPNFWTVRPKISKTSETVGSQEAEASLLEMFWPKLEAAKEEGTIHEPASHEPARETVNEKAKHPDGAPDATELFQELDIGSQVQQLAVEKGSIIGSIGGVILGKKLTKIPVFQGITEKIAQNILKTRFHEFSRQGEVPTEYSKKFVNEVIKRHDLTKMLDSVPISPQQQNFIGHLTNKYPKQFKDVKVGNLQEYSQFLQKAQKSHLPGQIHEALAVERNRLNQLLKSKSFIRDTAKTIFESEGGKAEKIKIKSNRNVFIIAGFKKVLTPISSKKFVAERIKTEVSRIENTLISLFSDLFYETANALKNSDLTKNAAEIEINQKYRHEMGIKLENLRDQILDNQKIDEILAPKYQQIESLPPEWKKNFKNSLDQFRKNRLEENKNLREKFDKHIKQLEKVSTSSECQTLLIEMGRQVLLGALGAGLTYQMATHLPIIESASTDLQKLSQIALLTAISLPQTVLDIATTNKYTEKTLTQKMKEEVTREISDDELKHEWLLRTMIQTMISGAGTATTVGISESVDRNLSSYVTPNVKNLSTQSMSRRFKEILGNKLSPSTLTQEELDAIISEACNKFQSEFILPERAKMEQSVNLWMDQVTQTGNLIEQKVIELKINESSQTQITEDLD